MIQTELAKLMELSKEELYEYMRSSQHSSKELRKIHKALRKYGSGLFMKDRYPYLPIIVSTISLIVSIVALIARIVS